MTPHIVIVGAGFAGLTAARRLARQGGGKVRVTLVDARNHHTFQPLLYQVATSVLQPQDVGHSVRGALQDAPDVRFRLGTVTGVDWVSRRLAFADGGQLDFDRLVVAAGAVTADYGVPGVEEHAFGLKGLGEAVALRNHVLRLFERASDTSPTPDGTLTFVVAGGGATGVEVSGALAELIHRVLRRDHPDVDVDQARVLLVEQADGVLGGFAPASQRYTLETLQDLGVEVQLGTGISEVWPGKVTFTDGSVIATETVVWAAGVRAHPLAAGLDLEQSRGGRVVVGPDLRVPGRPEAYVIGDIAAVPDGRGGLVPQVAPAAIQQGRHAADDLLRELDGKPPRRYRYRDKGSMATIGRNAAVAEMPPGLRFRGRAAWLAWLALHLYFLIGFRNRASVLLHWALSYFTSERGARAVFNDAPGRESARRGDTDWDPM
ncbi:MAG TPA: NAD(P)/FAD-dependent oxidoreductase [Egibacteraceae bacterium]|nr:NAD(P)/FAD-dependent oxidoreductase [Egibacteraceae bacterium]